MNERTWCINVKNYTKFNTFVHAANDFFHFPKATTLAPAPLLLAEQQTKTKHDVAKRSVGYFALVNMFALWNEWMNEMLEEKY